MIRRDIITALNKMTYRYEKIPAYTYIARRELTSETMPVIVRLGMYSQLVVKLNWR